MRGLLTLLDRNGRQWIVAILIGDEVADADNPEETRSTADLLAEGGVGATGVRMVQED